MKPPWMVRAELELLAGVREVAGPGDNPRILEYLRTTTLPESYASQDETAWCSAFVNACMLWGSPAFDGTNSARARSWLRWGVGVSIIAPPLGAVCILSRGRGAQPGPEVIDAPGHVALYVGLAAPGRLLLLGGNQSNAVQISSYDAGRVLGMRWAA